MKWVLILATVSIVVWGCFGSQSNQNLENDDMLEMGNNTTYISTYLIKVKKGETDKQEKFELQKVMKAAGFLKNQKGFERNTDGKFQIEFLDVNDNVLYQTFAENPLVKHFEAPNPNGEIESKTVKVQEDVIGIRMNYNAKSKKIKISKIENQQPKFLALIEINKE